MKTPDYYFTAQTKYSEPTFLKSWKVNKYSIISYKTSIK